MITDQQVERCAELANDVQSAMQGHELGTVLVVLLRLAVMSAHANDVERATLENQFKYLLDDVYFNLPTDYEENMQ